MAKYILLLIGLYCYSLQAQTVSIGGIVSDVDSGEKLIGATIFDSKSSKNTISNNFGAYSFNLSKNDTVLLLVSYVGYGQIRKRLTITDDTTIHFKLQQSIHINEVTVNANKIVHQRPELSTTQIQIKKAKLLPVLSGETDIIKVYQLMPGIQSANEGSGTILVRGGNHDQNLFLLDGVPLYNVSHIGGFLSVFDDNAINTVKVYKGGFPARYYGRLSSIVDIRMKEGNNKKLHGEIKLGLLSSKIFIEGPLVKNRTRFMLSARRSNTDVFTRLPTIGDDYSAGFTFYDINTKISHRFSEKDYIRFSFYNGRDKVFFKQKPIESGTRYTEFDTLYTYQMDYKSKWGNIMGAFHWNHIFNNRLSGNLSLAYTDYFYKTRFNFEQTYQGKNKDNSEGEYNYDSGIRDFIGKWDFDYLTRWNHNIRIGIGFTRHKFSPGMSATKEINDNIKQDTTYGNRNVYTNEYNLYIEDAFNISPSISANIGFHQTINQNKKRTFHAFQPRGAFNFQVSKDLSTKLAYSLMVQNLHLLSNPGSGLPTDIWVPCSETIKPQKSHQLAFNTSYSIGNNLELSFEAYYKTLENLIEFKDGYSFETNRTDWKNNIETNGSGKSQGLEFLIERKQGKLTGWIAYTLSKSDRKFGNINKGEYYPYKYDRRHDLAIAANYQLNDKIRFSANWVYNSGNMMTMATSRYNIGVREPNTTPPEDNKATYPYTEKTAFYYGSKNNYRMPAYHRLDISATFTKQKKRGTSHWQVSIYNVYFHKNVYFLYFTENGKQLNMFSLFPFIPSFSYAFRF